VQGDRDKEKFWVLFTFEMYYLIGLSLTLLEILELYTKNRLGPLVCKVFAVRFLLIF